MLFVLTFLTGAALGMYVYVGAWKPLYAPDKIDTTEAEANEWSMVGERRDVSGEVTASFRLLGDGSYVYLRSSGEDGTTESKKGRVPKSLIENLKFSTNRLPGSNTPLTSRSCADTDGYTYEYRFTLEGDVFELDECYLRSGVAVAGLADDLRLVWSKIEGGGREYSSFAEWLEEVIRRNLGTDE
ncbi:hypothetical protein MTYM_00455 [Methylococcales bacterium]|nr:hypothetical protein MTYM_00455 [Methylococcales bacterium]